MFEHSKTILLSVSFDGSLFRKELSKALKWIKNEEAMLLKVWCVATFMQYHEIIAEVFESIS
jgi:hypothetical protein